MSDTSCSDANTEEVYAHEIDVTWGDCDPAQIAYTGRLPTFALAAINGWWRAKTGGGWYEMELDKNVGTPFVSMHMDFRSPVTPRHKLICKVRPVRLGKTSVEFRVEGFQDGQLCFEGNFVSVFTNAAKFEKQAPPDTFRDAVLQNLPNVST